MIGKLVDRMMRKDRNVLFPYILGGKGMYILPTGQGVLFMLVLIVMLVGSINYSNNLGFLFTFLLGSMAFVSMLHTHRNLLGLSISSVSASPVFAGEETVFIITLSIGDRERSGVNYRIETGGVFYEKISSEKIVKISVPVSRRGVFSVDAMAVSTAYPFGLFRTWVTFYPVVEYLVYPKKLGGRLVMSTSGSEDESRGVVETEGTDDFSGLRPYRPGDMMRRLDWKTYARGKGLHTKEFSSLKDDALMIDWNDVTETETERKLSRLCDMVVKAHDMNLAYGLSVPGTVVPPGEVKDMKHRHMCLEVLALFNQST